MTSQESKMYFEESKNQELSMFDRGQNAFDSNTVSEHLYHNNEEYALGVDYAAAETAGEDEQAEDIYTEYVKRFNADYYFDL